jgi:transcriptional regulator with XRE-family HTH domain
VPLLTNKFIRIAQGLTQDDVVRRARGAFNQSQLSQFERGMQPRPDQLRALAKALGLPVAEADCLMKPMPEIFAAKVGADPDDKYAPPPPSLVDLIRGGR